MFKISFSPQVRPQAYLGLYKEGDTLIISYEKWLDAEGSAPIISSEKYDFVRYDFSQLPEGATLPREAMDCELFASDVTRKGGDIELTLLLPITADASAAARFPETILVSADGAIHVPE